MYYEPTSDFSRAIYMQYTEFEYVHDETNVYTAFWSSEK